MHQFTPEGTNQTIEFMEAYSGTCYLQYKMLFPKQVPKVPRIARSTDLMRT